ncbi:response regulator [Sabulicella rubraurantiaca]|uniref:response regulator n=1 Tax=Sabulicella rubraurantiaca TaxID=2811429 RepID=UPI001A96F74B|nr:response regulator [Sabulicella rubraurantiaca]
MTDRGDDSATLEDWYPRLEGRHFLVVEDEFLIACWLEQVLTNLGATVSHASNVAMALDTISSRVPDAALLDFNLGEGRNSVPIADALEAQGIPFGFITASDRRVRETHHRDRPTAPKPTFDEDLYALLRKMLADA